jgi:hypothetical protein
MWKRLAALGLAALAFAGAPALAAAPEARPWRLELGTVLSWQADYSGAGTARVRAPIWVSGEWRSYRWGPFELDSGAVGLGPLGPQLRWSLGSSRSGNLSVTRRRNRDGGHTSAGSHQGD